MRPRTARRMRCILPGPNHARGLNTLRTACSVQCVELGGEVAEASWPLYPKGQSPFPKK